MVFGIWLPILVVLSVVGGKMADYHTSFELPNSESRDVTTLLKSVGQGSQGGATAQIVFTAAQGTQDATVKAAMSDLFTKIAAIKDISIISPYSTAGARYNSPTKPISFAQISFPTRGQSEALKLDASLRVPFCPTSVRSAP